MAFVNPRNLMHRDALLHTDMNTWVANNQHLNAVLGGYAIAISGRRQLDAEDTYFVLQHFRRYLFVDGAEQEARLEDFDDPSITHNIGVTAGIGTFIDLAQIDWIVPGRLYKVVDCHHAVETDYI